MAKKQTPKNAGTGKNVLRNVRKPAKKASPSSAMKAEGKASAATKNSLKDGSTITQRIVAAFSGTDDVVDLILKDHKPLKKLIKVLKDSDIGLDDRRVAFEEFAPLLLSHAKPEETVLYTYMKNNGQLREEGFEGDVEHGLADQMIDEAKATVDSDLWSARIKVLAELVEHHIQEEESDMLPDFKKESTAGGRQSMANEYLQAKAAFLEEDDERELDEAQEGVEHPAPALHAH